MICIKNGEVAVFEDPATVLQLLFVTMKSSKAPIACCRDVLWEHSMARYQDGIQDVDPDALCTRAASFASEADSLYKLGVLASVQVKDFAGSFHQKPEVLGASG